LPREKNLGKKIIAFVKKKSLTKKYISLANNRYMLCQEKKVQPKKDQV